LTMLLYLARHAQTASSAVDSFNGRGELPLTERGQKQARKLGERLSSVRFAAVVRSPLGRTKETAELIAPGLQQAKLIPCAIIFRIAGGRFRQPILCLVYLSQFC